MKTLSLFLLFISLALSAFADAQSDFTRNIATYNSEMTANRYLPAAQAVARASQNCASVKNYEGAFNVITTMERRLGADNVTADSLPDVFYTLAQAKFDLYHGLDNTSSAQKQLQKMVQLAKRTGNKQIMSRMLFSAAEFYYSINQDAKGDQCISNLIKQYGNADDYQAADKAYQKLIDKAVSENDAELVEHTFENYMKWSDSIDQINADSELVKIRQEYAMSQETIAEKDATIRGKTGVIATFVVLFICALAALAVGVLFYLRVVKKNRKLRRGIEAANEQSAAKSAILHNMSSTMEPTLDKLDTSDPAVQNLKGYVKRVGELSDVGNAVPKCPEELEDVDLDKFTQSLVNEVKPLAKPGVKIVTDGTRGTARIDAPEVGKILSHLLTNAAKYTPENGRITLAYKKRGAKVHQFIVSDSGPGVPKHKRENLFKAFSESGADLSEGDGLGLPICALRAEKINGTLELDGDHSVGATFVLTVRN